MGDIAKHGECYPIGATMPSTLDRREFIAITGAALLGGATVLGSAQSAHAETAPRSTDPSKPPLTVQVASVSGNTITLAWEPPANNNAFWWFYVYDNGAKESIIGTGSAGTPSGATLKRLRSGVTHEFTVTYGDFIGLGDAAQISAPSSPVQVGLPASSDTSPPTTPANARRELQADGCSFLTKWDPSTDDVTPQDQLKYDFVSWVGFTQEYGATSGTSDMSSGSVRAVDAAGNRSALSNAT